MAPEPQDTQPVVFSQTEFHASLRLVLREAVRTTLINILEEEVQQFIQAAPYERSPLRRDRRNGHYVRDLGTSVGQLEALPVPRTRKGFQTQVFDRYQRRRREVDTTIGATPALACGASVFIQGVSTAQVGVVLEHLNGLKPSPTIVSRVFHKLEDEFETWKNRPLLEHYVYCFADGTYFSVIYDDAGCKMPILAVMGVRPDGQREVLAFSVGDRENQTAWEALLDELKTREDGGFVDHGRESRDAQCRRNQVCHVPPTTLHQTQNGKRSELRAATTTRPGRTGTQSDFLPGESHSSRATVCGVLCQVCQDLQNRGRMFGTRH